MPLTEPTPARGAWYTLAVLTLVYTFSFLDRQILSILALDIERDLRLDDAQLGVLYGTSFAIFYALFGLPLGALADRARRPAIIAVGLALWSLMTMASGVATSFAGLALARVGVGVGESCASPAAFSLLAELFPGRLRASVMALYSSGVFVGMGVSLLAGGWISQAWDQRYGGVGAPFGLRGWQVTLLAVGLLGLPLAAFVGALREPRPRGGFRGRDLLRELAVVVPPFTLWGVAKWPALLLENVCFAAMAAVIAGLLVLLTGDALQWMAYGTGAYAIFSWGQRLRISDDEAYRATWRNADVWLSLLGFGSLAMTTYVLSFWLPPLAMRSFHVPANVAGAALGLPSALASALGVVVGGRASDRWRRSDRRARAWVGLIAAIAPLPGLVALLHASTFSQFALWAPLVLFLANLWGGNAVAAYQELVPARLHGTIGAVYLLGSTMIGLAIGPYAFGKLALVLGSIRWALLGVAVPSAVATVMFLLLAKRLRCRRGSAD